MNNRINKCEQDFISEVLKYASFYRSVSHGISNKEPDDVTTPEVVAHYGWGICLLHQDKDSLSITETKAMEDGLRRIEVQIYETTTISELITLGQELSNRLPQYSILMGLLASKFLKKRLEINQLEN